MDIGSTDRAGIVIVVDERDHGTLAGLYRQVVSAPLDNAPRLAYAEAAAGTDPERADFIRMQIEDRQLREDPRQRELSVRAHQLRMDRGTEWAREVRTLVGWNGWT